MIPTAPAVRCATMVGVLMTAACTIEPRTVQLVDGAAGAGGQGGTSVGRDASQEASDARAGSDGTGGVGGADGSSDAPIGGSAGTGGSSGASGGSGSAGTGGSSGASGGSGAAGRSGSGGTGAGTGSGGAAGGGGAGATGGSAGAAGSGGNAGGSGGFDAGTTDGSADQTGSDAGDVRLVDAYLIDAPVGGLVVLFEETFPTGLGRFTIEPGCDMPPDWINNGGYARADAPATKGVNSIFSPTIRIPANVSNIRLRLLHQVVTQQGHDGAQVLVSKNSEPPIVVTNFMPDGYVNGLIVNPDTCVEGNIGQYPGWSGDLQRGETEANLSAAPLNVGPGDTVSVRLRIAVDSSIAMGAWDVELVRLTGTVQ